MWIALNNSFLSIVRKQPRDKFLTVRARVAGDIERVFPDAKVQVGGGTDYKFRAQIGDKVVADAIAKQIKGISYGNFKDSVQDDDRHDAYFNVWRAMMAMQKMPVDHRQDAMFDFYEDSVD
jgi:hypothetical protein